MASRNLSRSAFSSSQTRRIGTRRFLSTSPPGEVKNGEPSAEVDPCANVKNSLVVKEAEVLDLTVRNCNFFVLHECLAYLSCIQSRLRYLQADFLNLQRNAGREKEQTRDYAISRFASDLLETVDVLSIALKSIPPAAVAPPTTSSEGSESQRPNDTSPPLTKSHDAYLRELHTGVEITHRLLLQTLFKYNIKPFDPTGDQFDPNHHEALYQAPIQGIEPGTVIDCQKTGYMIKERVLRAAQVGVAQDLS